ncbi:MAG: protein kinase domain-containing protein [Myxococcota bacterium]
MTSGSSGGDPAPSGSGEGPEALLGRVLDGRYRIDSVLGTGGVGVVYRAEHTGLSRPVAIKVLHGYFGDREDLRLRFEREAKVLSALAHPHIVAITDYGVTEGMPYLAMELLQGQTLGDLLRTRAPLGADVALDIARGILRGLAFAHARGVLHRDLKPANVFLQHLPDDPYHVKLLDFGLAKIIEAEEEGADELTLTRSGAVLGTPAYMSPEQASGDPVDARADVYSAGCVLFELFGGRPPFVADTRSELVRMHMLSPVHSLSEVLSEGEPTPELQALLERALRKDPRDRFADGGEMLAAVDALPRPPVEGSTGVMARPSRGGGAPRRGTDSSEAPTRSGHSAARAPRSSASAQSRGPANRSSLRWVALGAVVIGVGLASAGAWLAWSSATPSAGDDLDAFDEPAEKISWVGEGDSADPGETGEPEGDEAEAETKVDDEPEAETKVDDEPEAGADTAAETDPEPEDDDADEGEGPQPREGEARPEGRYLLAGNVPRALRPYWARVKRGRPLTRVHHRNLRQYQQRREEDARPSLLLGHDFHRRGWLSDALTRYEAAFRLDPASRGDPRMLRNMVRLAGTSQLGAKASDLVVEIYGKEALDAVEAAIGRESGDSVERLESLKRRLKR